MNISMSEIGGVRNHLAECGCPSNTSQKYQDFIVQYVASNCSTSTTVVEVGVYHGGLTCQLAYLASKQKFDLFCLDISNEYIVKTKYNLKVLGYYDFVNILNMELDSFLAHHVESQTQLVVIVDADHRYSGCYKDCVSLRKFEKNLKTVFFHDYTLKNIECDEINVSGAIHDVFGEEYPLVLFGDNILYQESTVPRVENANENKHYFTGAEAAALFLK